MIILGSTGSIGVQALQIIKSQNLNIEVLCAGDNIALLNAQIAEFRPKIVVVKDRAKKDLVRGAKAIFYGDEGIIKALNIASSDFVLNALVGFSGVCPSLEAIRLGKRLALANKESLVVAGFLIDSAELAKIIPVDSEHFALKELLDSMLGNSSLRADSQNLCGNPPCKFNNYRLPRSHLLARNDENIADSADLQNLQGGLPRATSRARNDDSFLDSAISKSIKKLFITASGGAFRDLPLSEIPTQRAESALKHPNWAMGRKITIDSASMINKVFEILEAKWLFGGRFCDYASFSQSAESRQFAESSPNIDAVIERTSTLHAIIQMQNNALLAHFSANDMRLPIASALLGTKAQNLAFVKELDLMDLNVRFEKIDCNRYPLWALKDEVLKRPKIGAIINAANDILVERFLQNQIYFGDISRGIFAVLDKFGAESMQNIDEILEINAKIKDFLSRFKGFRH